MPVRVLIADDHQILAEGLQSLLSTETDFEVVGHAGDGKAAVERALALRPDVVLMDISMPGLNGVDATRALHEQLPALRVLMLSMHSDPEHVIRALEAGARGFIVKSSAAREVVEAIRAVYAGRRYLSAALADTVIDRYLGRTAPADPLGVLTPRERQVLEQLAEGKSSARIARALGLSARTVESYRARLYEKLDLHDLASLVRFAIQHGLTKLR